MTNKDIAVLDGPGARWTNHDRKASADIGYRVWNPFEVELRIGTGGRQDEAASIFTHVIDVFEL
jgi:hypothetical protein